jgi:RNA recognition motif-containing protein
VNVERRFNGDSKGSCFIKFATAEGLNNAVAATGVEFLGRQVWVAKTKPKSERVKEFGPRRGTFRGTRGGNYGGYNDGGYGGQSNNYDNGYQSEGYNTRGAGRGRGRGGRGTTRGGRGGATRRVEKVDQSKILFVGNLNYKTERDEIWDFFESIGKVVDVRIAKNQSGSVSQSPF